MSKSPSLEEISLSYCRTKMVSLQPFFGHLIYMPWHSVQTSICSGVWKQTPNTIFFCAADLRLFDCWKVLPFNPMVPFIRGRTPLVLHHMVSLGNSRTSHFPGSPAGDLVSQTCFPSAAVITGAPTTELQVFCSCRWLPKCRLKKSVKSGGPHWCLKCCFSRCNAKLRIQYAYVFFCCEGWDT